jgi:hypothetical protein
MLCIKTDGAQPIIDVNKLIYCGTKQIYMAIDNVWSYVPDLDHQVSFKITWKLELVFSFLSFWASV